MGNKGCCNAQDKGHVQNSENKQRTVIEFEGYDFYKNKIRCANVVYVVCFHEFLKDRKYKKSYAKDPYDKMDIAYELCFQRFLPLLRPGKDILVCKDLKGCRGAAAVAREKFHLDPVQFFYTIGHPDEEFQGVPGRIKKHKWWDNNLWLFCPFQPSTTFRNFYTKFCETYHPAPGILGFNFEADSYEHMSMHSLHSEFDEGVLETFVTDDPNIHHLRLPRGCVVRDKKQLELAKQYFRGEGIKQVIIRPCYNNSEPTYHVDIGRAKFLEKYPSVIEERLERHAIVSVEVLGLELFGKPSLELFEYGGYAGFRNPYPRDEVYEDCICQALEVCELIENTGFGTLEFFVHNRRAYLHDVRLGSMNGSILAKLSTLLKGLEQEPFQFREWRDNTFRNVAQVWEILEKNRIALKNRGGNFPVWSNSGALWYLTIGRSYIESFAEKIQENEELAETPILHGKDATQLYEAKLKKERKERQKNPRKSGKGKKEDNLKPHALHHYRRRSKQNMESEV